MRKHYSQSQGLCKNLWRGIFGSSVALLLILQGATVHAEPTVAGNKQSLTERECVAIALNHPLWKRMLQGREAEARAGVRIAGRWHNPGFGVTREKVDNETETVVSVSQTFDLGHRGAEKKAARSMLQATRSSIRHMRHERELEVRMLFYKTLQHKRRMDAHLSWLSRLKRSRFSGNDFRWVSREASLARAQMRSERAAYLRNWQRLKMMLGDAGGRFDRLDGQLFPQEKLPDLQTMLAGIGQLPVILALGQEAEAWQHRQRASGRVALPDLTVGVGRKTVEDNTRKDSGSVVSLSFSWPIDKRGKGHRQQHQSRAQMVSTRKQIRLLQMRAEAQGLWHQANELRSAYHEFSRLQRLHSPQRLIRSTENGYRLGRYRISRVLQAYRSALQSRLQLIDMAFAARKTQIDLSHFSSGGE